MSPRRILRGIAIVLFWIVFLMAFGLLQSRSHNAIALVTLGLIAILTFVSVLVHELGHAWAAHSIGGRVEAIVAFPFELRMRPWRLRMAQSRSRGDLAGYVVYAEPEFYTRRAHAFVAAAGPAADFAFALLAVLIALGLAAIDWTGGAPIMIETMSHGAAASEAMPSGLLPPEEEVARALAGSLVEQSRGEMAETAGLLATALAVLSAGGGLVNLIPFDGSDGEGIAEALFPSWRA